MFELYDTRDNRLVARVDGNKDRMETLIRKRIPVKHWAAFQMRRPSN